MNFFEEQNINVEIIHIVAQSYDGASVMSGHLNGVQAKVQKQYPAAIYIHCMIHRLNLVVLDLCKAIKVILKFKRLLTIVNEKCFIYRLPIYILYFMGWPPEQKI
jgi:hypothetical protein